LDVQLRAADRTDLPALIPLVHGLLKLQGRPFNLFEVEQSLLPLLNGDPARGAWLIEARRSAIGYATLSVCHSMAAGGCTAIVDQLFVREEARGHGAGGSALRLLLAEARRAGAAVLQVRAGPLAGELQRLLASAAGREPDPVTFLELPLAGNGVRR
jgi:GNAT superfamily N-acetyltransferase